VSFPPPRFGPQRRTLASDSYEPEASSPSEDRSVEGLREGDATEENRRPPGACQRPTSVRYLPTALLCRRSQSPDERGHHRSRGHDVRHRPRDEADSGLLSKAFLIAHSLSEAAAWATVSEAATMCGTAPHIALLGSAPPRRRRGRLSRRVAAVDNDPGRDLKIGAAVRKTDVELRDAVDRAIQQLQVAILPDILTRYGLLRVRRRRKARR